MAQRYSWSGMTNAEIQAELNKARSTGDTDYARSAYAALYRRGIKQGRRPAAEKPNKWGDASVAHVRRILKEAQDLKVLTGIQSDDGRTPKDAAANIAEADAAGVPPSLVDVATGHEFGTIDSGGRIPERSYLRSTGDANRKRYARGLAKVLTAYGAGQDTLAVRRLIALGITIRDNVQATIRQRIAPELADATKTPERIGNGSAEPVPLIYTGQLISSIRSVATSAARTTRELGGYNKVEGVDAS